jgi:hypothetical protein
VEKKKEDKKPSRRIQTGMKNNNKTKKGMTEEGFNDFFLSLA